MGTAINDTNAPTADDYLAVATDGISFSPEDRKPFNMIFERARRREWRPERFELPSAPECKPGAF